MKAIVYTKYGTLDVLELREVEKPTLTPDLPLSYASGTLRSGGRCKG